MYQIDNSSAVAVIPASTAPGIAGYFTDGNPATGVTATVLPAEFMNMVMMELANLVTAAGLELSKSDFTQVTQAVKELIATLATVSWANVSDKPTDLVYAASSPTLANLELNSATPAVDFHFGGDAGDYNVRLINNADGALQFINKVGALLNLATSSITADVPLIALKALSVLSQGGNSALAFYSADGNSVRYCIQHDDTSWNLYNYPDAGGGAPALSLARASGALAFAHPPTFAGQTPWDTGNFNPATKANVATTLAGYGITDAVLAATYNAEVTVLVNALAGKQATLGFTPVQQGTGVGQLPGNDVKIGWDGSGLRATINVTDLGKIWTDYNAMSIMAGQAVGAVGTYGLLSGAIANTGDLASGSSLRFCSINQNSSVIPSGTWRCMGYSQSTTVATVWMRVS